MSVLLLEQMLQLFIIILIGFLLVRVKVVKAEDSKVIAKVMMFVVMPCSILNAFQIDRSPSVMQQMLLALISALVIHAAEYIILIPFKKLMHLSVVEHQSSYYSNAGNFTIPVVTAMLGSQWVAFISIFIVVQTALLWTIARMEMSGKREISLKNIFGNINVIMVLIGFAMFMMRMRIPEIIHYPVSSLASMIGPIGMLNIGMILGGLELKELVSFRRIWRVLLLRLIVLPVCMVFLLKYCGLAALAPDGRTVLFVSLMSTITPAAATVVQMALLYDREPKYASSINILTTICCLLTMPIMIWLYQM